MGGESDDDLVSVRYREAYPWGGVYEYTLRGEALGQLSRNVFQISISTWIIHLHSITVIQSRRASDYVNNNGHYAFSHAIIDNRLNT